MKNRLPGRRTPKASKPAATPAPVPAPIDAGGTELPLPHERDQSTGQTDPQPADVMRQAKEDIDDGLVDTDLRATPGLDAGRRDELMKRERKR